MALTDPFRADVETQLRNSLEHVHRVTVLTATGWAFEVRPSGKLEVAYDLDWSPYCQARLTIVTPSTEAMVAALDHRLRPRIKVEAGYAYPDGSVEWMTMCQAHLQDATEPITGGTMDLTVLGAESITLDQNEFRDGDGFLDGYTVRTGVYEFIRSWIFRAYEPGTKPTLLSDIPTAGWGPEYVADYKHAGGSYWSAIEGVARAAGLRVYDDGLGVWHIAWRPWLSGVAARLRTGPTGTVLTGEATTERGRWFNQVHVLWRWKDAEGVGNAVGGFAKVSAGPHAANDSAVKSYTEEREGQVSQAIADGYAAHLLRKFLSRGRQYSFNAVAAYWLRPGMTVQVKLGRMTAYETVLIASVTHNPLTGHMAVTTQTPQDFE